MGCPIDVLQVLDFCLHKGRKRKEHMRAKIQKKRPTQRCVQYFLTEGNTTQNILKIQYAGFVASL